jgi:chorismate--pyruvate lyase
VSTATIAIRRAYNAAPSQHSVQFMDTRIAAARIEATNAAWMTASALASSDASGIMRAWLLYEGLLSTRLHELFGTAYSLQLYVEHEVDSDPRVSTRLGCADGAFLLRDLGIHNGSRPALFAQTYIPQFTLAQQPWLGQLGSQYLGEKLTSVADVSRGPFEFRRLVAGDALALAARDDSAVLWARRSVYSIDGAPLLVTEVFLPELERWHPS